MNFDEAKSFMSQYIKEGGLKEDFSVSQVSPLSYEHLSKINENGFVSTNSQDATKTCDICWERAYIEGFVKSDVLGHLQKMCKRHLDLIIVIYAESPNASSIPVTTKMKFGKCEKVYTSIPFYLSKEEMQSQKQQVQIREDEENLHFIVIIDSRFNYDANKRDGLFTVLCHNLKKYKGSH